MMICWSMRTGGTSGKARATCTTLQYLGDSSEVEYHGPKKLEMIESTDNTPRLSGNAHPGE